jgi:hypothetical protein
MGSETADRHIYVLLLYIAAEWKGEGLLDEFGILGTA